MIGTNRERVSGKSMLLVRLDIDPYNETPRDNPVQYGLYCH